MSVVDMAVTESGTGRPVVLLHAFPLTSAIFSSVLPVADYRVITPDLRGFGATPLGDDEPDLARMADDVVALMDRLELDSAIVGGVSMGGYVTMQMLRQAPQRVSGVLLIDTKAGADTDQARQGRLAMADAVVQQGRPVLEPMIQALLGQTTRDSRPDVVASVSGWLDAADPRAVAWAQTAMARRPDSHATLAECGLPAVVLVGEQDTLSPRSDADSMAQALGAPVLVVPDAGHLAVVENAAAARSQLQVALDVLSS